MVKILVYSQEKMVPTLKTIKRVNNALSLYAKVVDTLQEQMGQIDDTKAGAIHALLYVNTYIAFYKETATSSPLDLLDLLEKTIKGFKPELESFWDKAILNDLVSQFLIASDLLAERLSSTEHFANVMSTISRIPAEQLTDVKVPQPSSTATHLRSAGMLGVAGESKVFDKQAMLYKVKEGYVLKRHVGSLEKGFDITDDTSDEDLLTGLSALLLLYMHDSEFKLERKMVPSIIKSLTEQYSDKEKLVRVFLQAYKKAYEEQYRKSPLKNALLAGVAEFFPVLDSILPAGKLAELIEGKAPEVGFHLYDPMASEHDDSYQIYQTCLSFYVDVDHWKREGNKQVSEDSMQHLFTILSNHKFLYPHLQVAGRNMTQDLVKFDEPELAQLPLILQTELVALFEATPQLKEAFISFVGKFEQVNALSDGQQQKNLQIFFSKHQAGIVLMAQVLGIEGVRYLSNHLAGSALNLERILLQIPQLSETAVNHLVAFCQAQSLSLKDRPKEINGIVTSMIMLGMLTNIDSDDDEAIASYLALSTGKTPEEYMLLLAEKLLAKVLKGINVTLKEEEITGILNRVSTAKLVSLISASNNMSSNEYREVYLNLLKLDLMGGDIDTFLHEVTQDLPVGAALASHNKRIREKLEAVKINPDTALRYSKTLDIMIAPGEDDYAGNQTDMLNVLSGYIKRLKLEINAVASLSDREFSKLTQHINQLNDAGEEFYDFSTAKAKGLLGEINASLTLLAKNKDDFSDGFNEFSEHVRDQYKKIKESKRSAEKERKTYNFTVEQWKKERMDTFFLGDAVGCCLGTTSSQFQAMVQRRMDDAMLFHVVVDNETGRPAALIWLYLAETADKKIVLVANFFEVNIKYATNKKLRLALLDGLLKFTHQYCQDNPNIAEFYMNQLSYGWNQSDLSDYELESVALLDKVGGPFIPDMPSYEVEGFHEQLAVSSEMQAQVKEYTQQKYYLVSLSQDRFHKFNPEKLMLSNNSSALGCVSSLYGSSSSGASDVKPVLQVTGQGYSGKK
jgi:hypothetical protein